MTTTPTPFLDEFIRMADERNPSWREDLAKREAAAREAATVRLRDLLVAAGGDETLVDALMPTLTAVLSPRIDVGYGRLSGSMLVHTYGAPEARKYEALRLSTPWAEAAQ
jgi:hypothetical protein